MADSPPAAERTPPRFCSSCGVELGSSGKFCAACGSAIDGAPSTPAPGDIGAWQVCEIKLATKFGFKTWQWFVAEAIGPEGLYVAAESKRFRSPDEQGTLRVGRRINDAREAHTELIGRLARAGWEPWGRYTDDHWYALRFRKRAEHPS